MTSQLRVSGCPGRERSFRRNEWLRIRGQGYGWEICTQEGFDGQVPLQPGGGNGQVIATSEAYESKASALNGIKSVQTNAPSAEIEDQTAD